MNFKNLLLLFLFLIVVNLTAQDGTLDQTFGNGGIVATDIDSFKDNATSVAIPADDKMIM